MTFFLFFSFCFRLELNKLQTVVLLKVPPTRDHRMESIILKLFLKTIKPDWWEKFPWNVKSLHSWLDGGKYQALSRNQGFKERLLKIEGPPFRTRFLLLYSMNFTGYPINYYQATDVCAFFIIFMLFFIKDRDQRVRAWIKIRLIQ